jgi:eukaryotic-like serine/threonine-protein kinase
VSHDSIPLFGGFTLDLARGCLLRGGDEVHLRPQSYEVLKYLAEHRGRLVSKDQIIEEVWGGRAVTDNSLSKCIEEVREALGGHARQYVRNVRGRGYIFEPELGEREGLGGSTTLTEQVDLVRVVIEGEVAAEAREVDRTASQLADSMVRAVPAAATAEAGAARAAPNAEHAVIGIARHKRAAVIALVALALAAAAVLVYLTRPDSRGQIRSVAVLPFANGSGDPNLEYLSDGLSESLIDRLSQLPGMKVIARSSSFRYKGKEVDPREAARALGVEALIVGRVVQRGDDLQVRAELVDARDGTQVWGEQYSRRASDVQAVQEEISRAISGNLRLRLSGAQEQLLTKHATQNAQAYQLYLNGLYYWRKGPPAFENGRRALDYYNQAVALDPDFALAWAGVANFYLSFAGLSLLDPKEALPKAKAAARRALELDEALADAHSVLAGVKQDEWDWAGAERGHKRAVELNPNSVDARHRYARFLSVMGRHEEALAEVKLAQGLDPLRTGLRLREGIVLYIARRYDEAVEKLRHVIELEPDHAVAHNILGMAYDAKGMYAQAINEQQKAISIERAMTEAQIFLGYALAKSGRKSEAQAILDELKNTKAYVSPAVLAVLYIGLGDNEGAIASLERAYGVRDLQLQYLNAIPHFDSLRPDPRFQDLVRRVGLQP